MEHDTTGKMVEILLVEDNPGDAELTRDVFINGRLRNSLNVVDDGVKAMAYLRGIGEYQNVPRPDIVLLDLNLPKKDGREVLAEIKMDPKLKRLPVIILTAMKEEGEILKAYNLNVNYYLTKPVDMDKFIQAVKSIDNFWLTIVKTP